MLVSLFSDRKGEDIYTLMCAWVLVYDDEHGYFSCEGSSKLRSEFSGMAFVMRRVWCAGLGIVYNDRSLFEEIFSTASFRDKERMSIWLKCDLAASNFAPLLKMISLLDSFTKDNSFNSTCAV